MSIPRSRPHLGTRGDGDPHTRTAPGLNGSEPNRNTRPMISRPWSVVPKAVGHGAQDSAQLKPYARVPDGSARRMALARNTPQ